MSHLKLVSDVRNAFNPFSKLPLINHTSLFSDLLMHFFVSHVYIYKYLAYSTIGMSCEWVDDIWSGLFCFYRTEYRSSWKCAWHIWVAMCTYLSSFSATSVNAWFHFAVPTAIDQCHAYLFMHACGRQLIIMHICSLLQTHKSVSIVEDYRVA